MPSDFPPYSSGMTIVISVTAITKFQGNSLSGGVKYTGMGKFCDFRPKSPFISKIVRDRPRVTADH